MVGGDVVAVDKGLLAEVAVGCGGFEIGPDTPIV